MSTIKIQIDKPAIPIEFGKLKFEFDTSDESVEKFYGGIDKIQNDLMDIEFDENDMMGGAKEALRKGYDHVLGKGAFEEIYKQTPSVMKLTSLFLVLMEHVTKELESMGMSQNQKQKVDKYLQNKQHGNRNRNRNRGKK